MIEERRYLHRARYVVPMAADRNLPEILSDGAVLTEEGVITAVGRYDALQENDAVLVDHGKAVLLPAMVNCHSHLELSCFAALAGGDRPTHTGDMTGWIRELLAEREQPPDPEESRMASWQALARMYGGGCRGVIDIGNQPESATLGENFKMDLRFFLEVLGLGQEAIGRTGQIIESLADSDHLAVHSPYSVHPDVIRMVKERCRALGHLMPVHVAESAGEVEFLATGRGVFRDFLEERGVWDGSFKVPGKSPVAYLDDLQALDVNTLCVHCVQVSDQDIEIMASRGVTVCACPGSNNFLGVGVAPVDKFVKSGLRVVLGTDSPASNPQVSLWEEMRLLADRFPEIHPLDLLKMATRNGAELLGLENKIGSLATGCSANFLAVTGDLPEDDRQGALRWLVTAGLAVETEWVE
ncbi:MAG: amidohydrolase family protein [Proteobacteria bacterium]|nr:amidohydrolase family protein [Pseudomonadota bacterium]MBU1737167.1 amidohydrolase family protein [Pseudomonadota bacterium]